MSSKKKKLDDELSDVSSEEENIVKFVKKNKNEKEKSNEKILLKKTKREKKEESDSDSDSISNGNQKYKKVKKEKIKENSDNDDDNSEEEEEKEKINIKKNNKNKKKKKDKQEESISENEKEKDEQDNDKNEKKLKNNNKDKNGKESDSDSSSENDNKVKPKQQTKSKKETKKEKEKEEESDKDSDNLEKSEEDNKKDEKKEEENSEPKLVKNPNKSEEKEEKKMKSYNSGTWPELFVNNLSYKTTDESLKNYFSKYGEVESTKIVYDKETGRPKGVGFCKFCDSSSAAKALEDNDNLFLDGRPIAVSYSNDKKGSAKVRKSKFQGNKEYSGEKFSIFIGNLSFKTNEDGIKNLFEDCGNIIDIRIAKRPDGHPRGFAHVDFDNKEAMENALEKTGYLLDGRKLRIDKTTNQPSSNKKTFGENSYYKNKNKENKDDDLSKAKKTGKIINTESKSQKIENSDSDSDDE